MQVHRLPRKVTSNTQVRSSSGSSKLTHSWVVAATAGPAWAMAADPTSYNDGMARSAEQVALVSLDPEARQVVIDALSQEPDPERLALWVEVRGVQQGQFVYDLYFQAAADAGEEDAVSEEEDIVVVVPSASVDRLRGARLEWNAEGEGGLVLVNPNSPEPEGLGVPADVLAAGTGGAIGS